VIVVAGLTPAWQKILRFARLEVGEVNRAAEAVWCASGKVLNVAVAAARLGAACRTVSPVGGPARETFDREFAELRVDVDWIATSAPTRVCTTLLDEATATTTELVENAAPLTAGELQAYCDAYRRAAASAGVAVFTGSLTAGAPATFYRDLAADTRGRIVVDARGPELLTLLDGPKKPFLVKPNHEELAKTVGRPLADDVDLHRAMRELNDRGCEWVVVTRGPQAVWASSAAGELWRATPPRVAKVVNPIGCGDCLAAGLAAALDAGHAVIDALRHGIAAASDNLGSLLPARIDGANVDRLAKDIVVERVG
jgi:1-phosphofructokinase family hexose kinase